MAKFRPNINIMAGSKFMARQGGTGVGMKIRMVLLVGLLAAAGCSTTGSGSGGALAPVSGQTAAPAGAKAGFNISAMGGGLVGGAIGAGLTPREIDVLSLVVRGYTDVRIATELGIATATAHEHVERAKHRLGTRSRAELAAVAVSFGIVAM